MASNICSPKDFFPSENMIFTKPKTNNSGGKTIGILNSTTKKSIFMQTPVMMNWGVNTYDNPNGKSYDFSLQFPREEFSTTETNVFLDMLTKFEENIKEMIYEDSPDYRDKYFYLPTDVKLYSTYLDIYEDLWLCINKLETDDKYTVYCVDEVDIYDPDFINYRLERRERL